MHRAISCASVGVLAVFAVFALSYIAHVTLDTSLFAATWIAHILAPLAAGYVSGEKFVLSMLLLGVSMAGVVALLNLLASSIGIPVDLAGPRGALIVFSIYLPISTTAAFLVGAIGSKIHEYVGNAT